MSVQQSDLNDPALVTEVDLARTAAQEEAGDERVGEYVSYHVEDAAAVTHHFEADKTGYRGWRWAVTITSAGPDTDITVSEVVLLPGPSALTAPDWIPWQNRVQAGDLGPGDLLPTDPDDPRLVPAYLASDDPQVEDTALETGLGRVRVMSRSARLDAADRWHQSEFGPRSDMARSAPAHCGTCGFYLPLAGALQAAFGTCGNELSPADAHVVHAEYGCGAHSEAEVEQVSPVLVADLIYDDARLDVEPLTVVDQLPPKTPEPAHPDAEPPNAPAATTTATGPSHEATETAEAEPTVAEPRAVAATDPKTDSNPAKADTEVAEPGVGAVEPERAVAEPSSEAADPAKAGLVVAEPGVAAVEPERVVAEPLNEATAEPAKAGPEVAEASVAAAEPQGAAAEPTSGASAEAGPKVAEPGVGAVEPEPSSLASAELAEAGAADPAQAGPEVAEPGVGAAEPERAVDGPSGEAAAVPAKAGPGVAEPSVGAIEPEGAVAEPSSVASAEAGLEVAEPRVGAVEPERAVPEPSSEAAAEPAEAGAESGVGAVEPESSSGAAAELAEAEAPESVVAEPSSVDSVELAKVDAGLAGDESGFGAAGAGPEVAESSPGVAEPAGAESSSADVAEVGASPEVARDEDVVEPAVVEPVSPDPAAVEVTASPSGASAPTGPGEAEVAEAVESAVFGSGRASADDESEVSVEVVPEAEARAWVVSAEGEVEAAGPADVEAVVVRETGVRDERSAGG